MVSGDAAEDGGDGVSSPIVVPPAIGRDRVDIH
jgi:hypothetical protein